MYSWFNNTGNSTRPFVDWHHTHADMRYLPGSSSFYVLNVRGGPGNKTRLTQGLWIQVTCLHHQSDDDGWCEGVLSGKRGLFPENFVQFSRGEDVTIMTGEKG